MARASFSIDDTLTLLAATPARVAAATAGLDPAQLRARPSRHEWSANDVLAHIRACADTRGDVVFTILAEEQPTFRAVNPRSWMTETNYLELEFSASFRAFARQRTRLLQLLEQLPRHEWSRSASVTGAGAPLDRTVLFYAQWVARHERPHVKQIEDIARSLRAAHAPRMKAT